MRILGIGLCALGFTAAGAQTINLHGVVTSGSGTAIPGATVTLVGQNLKATTGADGSYTIQKSSAVLPSLDRPKDVALENGILRLTVRNSEPVSIQVFDVGGHLIRRETLQNPANGTYTWDLADNFRTTGLLLVKASIGGYRVSLHCLPMGAGGTSSASFSAAPASATGLARFAATVDTLKASATGYVTKSVAVASYESTVNIALEPTSTGLSAPTPSAGCGKDLGSLKAGNNPLKITSSNLSRDYTINIPTNYNKSNPHRLVFTWHWINASDDAVVNGQVSPGGGANWAYFGLKRMSDSAGVPTIFIAPSSRNGTWDQVDHVLFDDLLKLYKTSLCIDTGRVFATGFSFGAMQTNSLSLGKQKDLRAVATLAAANYNIYLPTNTHLPIAYLGMTGLSDGTCPFINNASAKTGGLFAAIVHAQDNGCTVPANPTKENPAIKTTTVGSKSHVVYDFPNCKQGYPVKYITFDGGHIAAPADGGNSDNGTTTWAPRETWKFFMQF